MEKKDNGQVWIEEVGGLKVLKLDSLASTLKKAVCDSYVAMVSRIDASESDIQGWFILKVGIQVEVTRINWSLFWIKPTSHEDFSKLNKLDSSDDCLIRRVDLWTEVLVPVLHTSWVHLEGIPLHAWDKRVFQSLGECLGIVLEKNREATC